MVCRSYKSIRKPWYFRQPLVIIMAPYTWDALMNLILADQVKIVRPYYVGQEWCCHPPPHMTETDMDNLRVAYERKFGMPPESFKMTWAEFGQQGAAAPPAGGPGLDRYYAVHDFISFYNDWAMKANGVTDVEQRPNINTKKPGRTFIRGATEPHNKRNETLQQSDYDGDVKPKSNVALKTKVARKQMQAARVGEDHAEVQLEDPSPTKRPALDEPVGTLKQPKSVKRKRRGAKK